MIRWDDLLLDAALVAIASVPVLFWLAVRAVNRFTRPQR